jgi:SAM-dependent methyltransferase
LERHRLIWLYLHNRTNLFSDQLKLLHVAPEPVLQQYLQSQSNLDYVGTDIESPLANIKMDLTSIPHQDGSFDAIICSHVLEHIQDDRAAMRELVRILTPGGWAILQVPIEPERATTFEDASITSPEERFRLFKQHDHVRIYGRDYKDRLEQAGFEVHVDGYVREMGQRRIRRYALNVDEDIYFCRKPAITSKEREILNETIA